MNIYIKNGCIKKYIGKNPFYEALKKHIRNTSN